MKNYSFGTTEQMPASHTVNNGAFFYNTSLRKPLFFNEAITNWQASDGIPYDIRRKGTTEDRPLITGWLTDYAIGFQFFDTTLNKPIWWNGTNWVDATGATV